MMHFLSAVPGAVDEPAIALAAVFIALLLLAVSLRGDEDRGRT